MEEALRDLATDWLDLVLAPWPDDGRPVNRQVRNEQTTTFLASWCGPLASLAKQGKVQQLGGDGLTVWQIERVLEATAEPRIAFNLIPLTPCHSKVPPCPATPFYALPAKAITPPVATP